MLSSFVSHKHGPSLLPSLSLSLATPLICFYLRPAVPTTMIGVFTPPTPDSLSNGRLTKGSGGEALSSQPHCWFSTGKLHHSSTHSLPSLPLQPRAAPLLSLFRSSLSFFLDLKVWMRSWIHFRCEMQPLQTLSSRSLLLFWLLPMLLSPSLLWAGAGLSYMARRLGLCSHVASLRSDWSGRRGAGVGRWRHTGCTVAVV